MAGPRSFTGEDVAELHGHGGPQNLAKLLAATLERGARVAEPGEFTRRAVANGKLDLLRAEALLEVIHAGSERAWRLAQANLEGRLGAEIAAIEKSALALLAELEGWIDFPEADIDPVAEPGEFTRRAVANGKLDLLRAEALLEVIHAGSERAWRLAQANLEGRLGAEIAAIEKSALALLAELEGWIDFPEADIDPAA